MTDKFTTLDSFVLFPEMGDDLFGNYSPKANPDHTLISEQDTIKERKDLVLSIQQGAENQEKWLSGHSLLEQYNNCEAHDIRPSGGALKYICLGSSSSGIDEDGWHDKYAMPYFQNLFNFYQENKGLFTRGHFPSHLLPICEQLKSFWDEFNQGNREEHAKKIAQTIIDLKPGECYHMPSGFAGDPSGHSMIILFQKQKGNAYTIKVYEGSVNASKYAGSKTVNHKKYVRPYIKFEDVTCEELLFTKNPHKSFDPIILTKLLLLLEKTNRGDLNYESVVSLLTPIQRQFVPWA